MCVTVTFLTTEKPGGGVFCNYGKVKSPNQVVIFRGLVYGKMMFLLAPPPFFFRKCGVWKILDQNTVSFPFRGERGMRWEWGKAGGE